MNWETLIGNAMLGHTDLQRAEDQATLKMMVERHIFEKNTDRIADQRRSIVILADGVPLGPFGNRQAIDALMVDIKKQFPHKNYRILDGAELFN